MVGVIILFNKEILNSNIDNGTHLGLLFALLQLAI
jgi:hypothetical protein